MPSGAWDHVFPATKQLPKSQALIVEPVVTQVVGQATKTRGMPDLACVVRCCPGLQQLAVQHDIRSHDSVPLQSLTALTNLWDLRTGGVDDADAAVLPQLTSLRHLKVGGMSEPGLLRLSVLQQLTSLSGSITYRGRERGCVWPGQLSQHFSFQSAGGKPSVQRQLLNYCKESYNLPVREEAQASLALKARWRKSRSAQVAGLGQQLAGQTLA